MGCNGLSGLPGCAREGRGDLCCHSSQRSRGFKEWAPFCPHLTCYFRAGGCCEGHQGWGGSASRAYGVSALEAGGLTTVWAGPHPPEGAGKGVSGLPPGVCGSVACGTARQSPRGILPARVRSPCYKDQLLGQGPLLHCDLLLTHHICKSARTESPNKAPFRGAGGTI